MKKIILKALLSEWIEDLQAEVTQLDDTLPIERKMETSQRLKDGISGISAMFMFPMTHPEAFEEFERPLAHEELDGLRSLISKMSSVVEELNAQVREDRGDNG